MLTGSFLTQIFGVFGTGVLASLSPCVYPMIPITVGFLGSQAKNGNRSNVLLYVFGQSLAFVLIGVFAVKLGETLGFSSQSPTVNLLIGIFLLIAGGFSLVGRLPTFMNRWNDKANAVGSRKAGGALAAFLFGVSAALIASPCTSPILGGVLALMSTASSAYHGIALMVFYSLGFSLVFLILGLGFMKAAQLPRAGKWMVVLHKVTGVLLIAAGGYFLWNAYYWSYVA